MVDIINLLTPPALSESFVSKVQNPPKKRDMPHDSSEFTTEELLSVDVDEVLDRVANLKPGERAQGPLSQEQLDKIFKKQVKLPNGEMATVFDFKGSPLEGHEGAMIKLFQAMAQKGDERRTGSSSRKP
jgi:hypothetical protein